ncbi:MAG: TlpA family protein disulfide reductase [Bacteroidetes bacterium]|nr:TlpA family protein disulfide reductase [Bacteroidota bacterium]
MIHKILIILSLVILTASAANPQDAGKSAPLFSGKTSAGETVNLADYRGKVLILDFWASWCKPCKEEFPFLVDFYSRNSDSVFSILAVNIDNESGNVNKFLAGLGKEVPFKVILDPESKIPSQYNIDAMPTVFVIDKKGLVRYVHIGFKSEDREKYKNEVDKLLSEQ